MTLTVVSEQIGYDLASQALADLAKFLNAHVVSSGNKMQLCLPEPTVGEDGVYTITVSIAFALVAERKFLAKR